MQRRRTTCVLPHLLRAAHRRTCAVDQPVPLYAAPNAPVPGTTHHLRRAPGPAARSWAATLCLAAALLALAAAPRGAAAQGGGALPGNAVVEPGVNYFMARYRTQGGVEVEECSEICQVEVGCIAWTWYRIGRLCWIGFELSALAPLADRNVISGRPAQVHVGRGRGLAPGCYSKFTRPSPSPPGDLRSQSNPH